MSQKYPGGLITKSPVTPSGPYETSTASGIWTLDQQAYWRKLNQWPIAGSPAPDAQFNYVTMLLHGDGTNGAQNNTFLDSSTNNFTITRNGNTTQGSFSPYGSNWSNHFDGNGDYLSAGSNSAFAVGTGDFTFQTWVYPIAYTSPVAAIFDTGSGVVSGRFSVVLYNGGTVKIDNNGNLLSSSSALPLNQWTFISVIRSSGTMTMYFNGTSVASGSVTVDFTETQSVIGKTVDNYYFQGYISNLRLVKGTALANTVPTAPLTAVSGTSLLTCADNRFIDDSTNNFVITANGNASVQRFNPFGASTAYSTSVIGGSGYFDGSGDYLNTASNAAFTLGSSGNFTVECWVYLNGSQSASFAAVMTNMGNFSNAYANRWAFTINALNLRWYNSNGEAAVETALVPYQWIHLAAVRTGSVISIYVNGVEVGAQSSNQAYTTEGSLKIGFLTSAAAFNGYISDARVVKGTAVYTSNFTPPTSPVTAITNTQLLTNFTNGAIFDNAMMNDLETVGNAQISTSVVKYGTGSLAFDGTGDYLAGPASLTGVFGTGNFTIEAWVYTTASSGTQCVFDTRFTDASTAGCFFGLYSSNAVLFYTSATVLTGGTVTANTWNHIAAVRSGTTVTVYLNGTSVASGTRSNDFTQNYVQIGGSPFVTSSTPNSFFGYIDDLRITKGYARYTANFTPPTAAFPNIGPT